MTACYIRSVRKVSPMQSPHEPFPDDKLIGAVLPSLRETEEPLLYTILELISLLRPCLPLW